MSPLTSDIQPLATFRRKPNAVLQRIKKSNGPVTLTVNGKPAAVVQDAAAYQRLLDIAAEADVYEAIRQSVEDEKHGRTRPAREVFAEFRRKHGLQR